MFTLLNTDSDHPDYGRGPITYIANNRLESCGGFLFARVKQKREPFVKIRGVPYIYN